MIFRAAPAAHGSSQARGSNKSYSCQPTPQPQQCEIQAETATYTTAHSNARSLTHSARPGIKPTTSVPNRICFYCATTGAPITYLKPQPSLSYFLLLLHPTYTQNYFTSLVSQVSQGHSGLVSLFVKWQKRRLGNSLISLNAEIVCLSKF